MYLKKRNRETTHLASRQGKQSLVPVQAKRKETHVKTDETHGTALGSDQGQPKASDNRTNWKMSGVQGRQPSSFKRSIATDEHSSEGVVGSGLFAVKEPARALARLLRLHARDVRIRRWSIGATPATQGLRDARSPEAKTPIPIHGW